MTIRMVRDGRLDPCPFCGHAPWFAYSNNLAWQYWARCDTCDITPRPHPTPAAAIAAWNTRAWSPSPPAPPLALPPPWPPEARCYIIGASYTRPTYGVVIPHGPAAAVLRVITREWQATSVIAASAGLSTPVTRDVLHGLTVIGTVLRRFWCEHNTACGGCVACFANPLRHEWRR